MITPLKILHVEDNADEAESMAKLLMSIAPPGTLEMFNATNMLDALRMSEQVKASVTFLDLLVPLRPGEEPIGADHWRLVSEQIPLFWKPVIVVTALNDPDFEIEFECVVRQGAQAVFTKPKIVRLFSWISGHQKELFAEHLLSAAGRAVMRSKQNGK